MLLHFVPPHNFSLAYDHPCCVVIISEHSELELIGDKYAETALHNGGGLERMSGGERQRCQSREGQCRSWEVPGNAMSGI